MLRRRRRSFGLAGAAALAVVILGPWSAATAQDEDQPDEQVQGVTSTLVYEEDGEQVPVEGAELTVESSDGSFSEEVTTDDEGHFEVEVPEPGRYQVTLDVATLPDGVSLVNEDRATVISNVGGGRVNQVRFLLTTGGGGQSFMDKVEDELDEAADLTVEGISLGLTIAMCAIGLSLIFGTTGLVNFAHAEMITFGALMAYYFNATVGMNLVWAAPLGIVAGGLLGWAFNRGVWRPLRDRGTSLVAMLVISIGIGLLLRYAFVYQVGAGDLRYTDFTLQRDKLSLGVVDIPPRELWLIGLSTVLLVGVGLFMQHTRTGTAMRAVSDNRDLAESSGIDVERIVSRVWIAGGALAATGGIFLGLNTTVEWQMGFQLLLLVFAGVILGGIGTTYGAVVGSLIIGLMVQLSTLVIDSELKNAGALLVLIVALLVRPQGILGQAERVG